MENKGKKKLSTALATVDALVGEDGEIAEQIFDGKIGKDFKAAILPGKKATVQFAFDAPADAKHLTIEVSPGIEWDASQWELKL
ncbi:DUF4352 domain-containing protein [Streptomyces sp. M10(2022)]